MTRMSLMPRLLRLTFVAVIAGFVLGCGGEKPPVATSAAPASSAAPQVAVSETTSADPSGQPSLPVALPVNADSQPSDVVLAFLNAMRDGNSAIASELLSDQARAETTKHQWPVQPPGAPSATYQLGQASYVDANQSGVHIPCLWTEPDGAGGTIQFEVIWALRRLDAGWRVAGFATEVVPGRPPYFFNFEDIANLRETQAAAEAALTEAAAVESSVPNVAERPGAKPITR